jgi:hypothetical protein
LQRGPRSLPPPCGRTGMDACSGSVTAGEGGEQVSGPHELELIGFNPGGQEGSAARSSACRLAALGNCCSCGRVGRAWRRQLPDASRGEWRQPAPRCCGLALRQDRAVALAVWPGTGALNSRGRSQIGLNGPSGEAPCRLCSASPCRPSAQTPRQALLCQLLACEDTRIEERPSARRALAALGEPLGG